MLAEQQVRQLLDEDARGELSVNARLPRQDGGKPPGAMLSRPFRDRYHHQRQRGPRKHESRLNEVPLPWTRCIVNKQDRFHSSQAVRDGSIADLGWLSRGSRGHHAFAAHQSWVTKQAAEGPRKHGTRREGEGGGPRPRRTGSRTISADGGGMTELDWEAGTDSTPMLRFLLGGGKLSQRKAGLFAAAVCRRIWRLLTDDRSHRAVETTERFADGLATTEQVSAAVTDAWRAPQDFEDVPAWAAAFVGTGHIIPAGKAALVTALSAAGSFTDRLGRLEARHESYVAYDIALAEVEGHAQQAMHWDEHLAACEARSKDDVTRRELANQAALLRDILGPLPFRPLPSIAPTLLAGEDGAIVRMTNAIYDDRILPSGEFDRERLGVLADALEEVGADTFLVEHLRSPGPHVRGCVVVDLLTNRK